jgi:hypothetical protein
MQKILMFIVAALLFTGFQAQAQRNCGAMEVLERQLQEDPDMARRMTDIERHTKQYVASPNQGGRAVVTIPVVVHVVWRTNFPAENISDAQINSQIAVLNADFRMLNADASLIPSTFTGVAADAEVQFCLAQRKPDGTATNGIMRYQVSRTTDWGTNDAVKNPTQGGVAPWNASSYLNIWVCSIGGGILGYAQFPGGSASTDGVVNDYRYFGTTGTATAPFNKGRTATHEVGHYLNLRHIWGDATCGSDLVGDTPTHNTANYGCPAAGHRSTCTGTPIEMTMNYMDYSDDACMYMFSAGQKTRMQALFAAGGSRYGLTTSLGCTPPTTGGTCGTPSGLASSNVATTTATVSWAAVSGATSYNLQYKTAAATTWTTSSVTGTSANFTGLVASTTYNFQVQAVCSGTAGSYSSIASFTTTAGTTTCASVSAYETNETRTTAKSITVNTNATAAIGTSTDQDWYKFSVTNSQRNFKVDLTNLPADYDLKVYNSAGTLLFTSQNTGTTAEMIKYNSAPTGTYYVHVYGYGGAFSTSSCYTLRVTRSSTALREAGNDGITVDEGEESNDFVDFIEFSALGFEMFPNPSNGITTLKFDVEEAASLNIRVSDLTGREIYFLNTVVDGSKPSVELNLFDVTPGVYFVRVDNGSEVSVQKLMITE